MSGRRASPAVSCARKVGMSKAKAIRTIQMAMSKAGVRLVKYKCPECRRWHVAKGK